MSYLKVLVIGDNACGKTSLVNRIVHNTYQDTYKATLGCEFGLKTLEIAGEQVRVQLWDIAGQDRLGGISRMYCRDANGAMVICDLTNPTSIERVTTWKRQVDDNAHHPDGSPIPMVICLNKVDLFNAATCMKQEEVDRLVSSNKFLSGMFTSAKTSLNVEESLSRLVKQIITRAAETPSRNSRLLASPARVGLEKKTKKKPKKSGCC
jgi:small GTP-binding protein